MAADSKSVRADLTHGTRTGYVHAQCRCDDCREAEAAYQRSYRTKNRDRLNEYDRRPERDTRLRDDPAKRKARGKARDLWRNKVRSPCEVCGASSAQMHHEDYSRPLDVRWLCAKCHGVAHRQAPEPRERV